MSVERLVRALRELQKETATTDSCAGVLANIDELEERGRIDVALARCLRRLIDCLAGLDLEARDRHSLFEELTRNKKRDWHSWP